MCSKKISSAISRIISFIIVGLRPLLGPAACRHPVSCTIFAQEQLETQPIHKALYAITLRILSCIKW